MADQKKDFFDRKGIDVTIIGVTFNGFGMTPPQTESPKSEQPPAPKTPKHPWSHRAFPDSYEDADFEDLENGDDEEMGNDDLERDPTFFAFAEKNLPIRGEIAKALNLVTNMTQDSLFAAVLIEEVMRHHMPDAQVDRLVTAAILIGAANYDDISDEFSSDTRATVDDFYTVLRTCNKDRPDIKIYKDISMDGQRLYIATIAADMEIVAKEITSGGDYPAPDHQEMRAIANFLSEASRVPAERPTKGDVQLMLRTMHDFNAAAKLMGVKIDLVLRSPDMTISVRDLTKRPDAGQAKPKFDDASRKTKDFPHPSQKPQKKKNNKKRKPPENGADNYDDGGWDGPPKTPDWFM